MNLRANILIDKKPKLEFSDSAISPVLILQTKLPFLDTPGPTPENIETHNPSQIRTSRILCPRNTIPANNRIRQQYIKLQ